MTEEEGDEASGCQKEVDEITRRGCLFLKRTPVPTLNQRSGKELYTRAKMGKGRRLVVAWPSMGNSWGNLQ